MTKKHTMREKKSSKFIKRVTQEIIVVHSVEDHELADGFRKSMNTATNQKDLYFIFENTVNNVRTYA